MMIHRDLRGDAVKALFHAYDVRGTAGEELDCEQAMAIARAFGDTVRQGDGRFVIGHDVRITSPSLAEAVSVGLRSGGHHVTHIGPSTSPMLYWYGAEGGFDGSIMITASHLPPRYNGFKLSGRDALPLNGEQGLPQVAARVRLPFVFDQPCTPVIHHASPLEDYVRVLRRHLRGAGTLRLAVDAGNGSGGTDTHRVFEHFKHLWLHELNFDPDGHFPNRSPNPLDPGALDRLSRCVVRHGCAFGVAFDGDADRAVVVDERGERVSADLLGALLAARLLRRHPGATVLYDLRASRTVPEAIEAAGGKAVRTRVGHAFVKRAMREHRALFALELSGHYYYADLHSTDNGLRTLIEVTQLVSTGGQPLSERLKPLQRYALSGEINLRIRHREAALAALEQAYPDGRIDHLDGLSVDYPQWWFNARPSRTEPVLRLSVGAADPELLRRRVEGLQARLAPFLEPEAS